MRVPLSDLSAGERALDAESARYLTRVLRLGPGDPFEAFDPEARQEADAEIIEVGRQVKVRLGAPREASHVAAPPLEVVQSLAKGAKLDVVVRAVTELGATRVLLARAERSVKQGADLARLRRIAVQAARQCGRGDVPSLEGVLPLEEALEACRASQKLCFHAASQAVLEEAMVSGPVAVAIGPEGGFSSRELSAMVAQGFTLVRLGDFVLRTETAGAAALGAIAALRARRSS